MTSIISLGILVLCIGVVFLGLKADKHYRSIHTKGRQDYIRHVNHAENYKGLAQWSYQRGREAQRDIDGEDI